MARAKTQQKTADYTAEYPGSDKDDLVVLSLAHPLSQERDLRYLGLPLDAKPKVGETIAVSKNAAKSLINAGYAQVDPENRAAVKATLGGASPEEVADIADHEPAATEGQDADASDG